ncbi:MAG: PadR family transcriptional regulator [Microbacterium sp.]
MVTLVPLATDDPRARRLLTDYFAMRAEAFPPPVRRTSRCSPRHPSSHRRPESSSSRSATMGATSDAEASDTLADGPHGVRYEVKHLYLDPSTRGRGALGSRAAPKVSRRRRAWGAADLVLDTHTLEAAGGLYARSGFVAIDPHNDNPNATRWYGKTL